MMHLTKRIRLPIFVAALALALAASATKTAESSKRAGAEISRYLAEHLAALENKATARAWVYFTDKGPDATLRLAAVERNLTPEARARRMRSRGEGAIVDMLDVGVSPRYQDAVAQRVSALRHTSRWLNAVSVELTREQLARVSELPFVRRVELVRALSGPVEEAEPVSSKAASAPAQRSSAATLSYGESFRQNEMINVPALHALGFNGSGITIAVLDAGFNFLEHECFAEMNIADTWDFVNGDANVDDEAGQMGSGYHGVYVLSTCGGYAPGKLIGPAYRARFLLAKTENTDWERHIEEDDWIAGAEWADSLGADIINSSLSYLNGFTNGELSYDYTDMDGNTTIVTKGADIAASRGILVVNSAGNNGAALPGQNTLGGPADGDSVLAIAAVDSNGVRASYSSMGPSFDGRTKPDVAAQGTLTYCASPFGVTSYTRVSGTSLSSPLVAGAAALVMQANPTLSAHDILLRLRDTADNAATPDNETGWGIINAYDAALPATPVDKPVAPRLRSVVLHSAVPNPFNPSTTVRFTISEPANVTLRVFDSRGRLVTTLLREARGAGTHAVQWHGDGSGGELMASGVYFVRLDANGVTRTSKVVLLK